MSSYTELGASMAARAFFYPSLLFNIAKERLQEDWHWCDLITESIMLGAIPFPSMLANEFQQLGVKAVVTLNEEFEIFISPDQYAAAGIAHLHLPTIDFLYAPPVREMHRGVDFIHEHAARRELVYVHCKAGRGRSSSLVLCYLIKYHRVAPAEALAFVQSKRQQVRIHPGQWRSIEDFWRDCGCPGDDGSCTTAAATPAIEPVLLPSQPPGSCDPDSTRAAPATGNQPAASVTGAHVRSDTALCSSLAPSGPESQQDPLQRAAQEAADAVSGFGQAAAAAAAPEAASRLPTPPQTGGSCQAPGPAQQQPQHGAARSAQPEALSPAAPAEQTVSTSAFALWQGSTPSSRAQPPSLACVEQPDAPAAATAAAGQTGGGSDGHGTPPPSQRPLQAAAEPAEHSAGSSLDMERSTSLVWVSAPSADLGEGHGTGLRAADGGANSSSDGAADAAGAGPDPGSRLHAGGIEVAADYAAAAAAPQGAESAAGSTGGSCRPTGFSWYQSMLPQKWVDW